MRLKAAVTWGESTNLSIGQTARSLATIVLLGAAVLVMTIFWRVSVISDSTARSEIAPQAAVAITSRSISFTDLAVQAAQTRIQKTPEAVDGYNQLCAAYLQKARETGDFGFNAKAELALNRSFELAPDNNDALKLQATLLLTYHQFGEALEVARHAQQLRPQDPAIYGAITDALVELGDYSGAIAAAQTMVNLRPHAPAYARISYLRALHGDTEGAIEAMQMAAKTADPGDSEGVAWYRVQLGTELMNAGRWMAAEHELDHALKVFPGYHLALAAKARTRIAAGDIDHAIELYQQALERVPLPDTAIALGDLYTHLGNPDKAKQQYDLMEFIERTGGTAFSNTYSRQLALFWADHNINLDAALAIAQQEKTTRSDVYTFDVLAWCLFKQGLWSEAKTSIQQALRLGTQDARIYYHAGMIYHQLGDRRLAKKYLQRALQINPSFDILQADIAKQTLNALAI